MNNAAFNFKSYHYTQQNNHIQNWIGFGKNTECV